MSKFFRSFVFAGRGLALAFRGRNFRVMAAVAFAAVGVGAVVGLSATEWNVVIVGIGLVLSTETVNTAIERLADAVDREPNPTVGQAKDLAAGASLLVSLAAAAIGIVVFAGHIW